MNKFIEEELNKCKLAAVEQVSDTEYLIKKKTVEDIGFEVNKYYIVELENYIINPPETFTLSANWNNDVVPKSKNLKVMVTQIMGKMIKVDGCGFDIETNSDLNDIYLGLWLPQGGVKILKKL